VVSYFLPQIKLEGDTTMSFIMTPAEQMAVVGLLQWLSVPGMKIVVDSEKGTVDTLILGHTDYCVLRSLEGRINQAVLESLEPEVFE